MHKSTGYAGAHPEQEEQFLRRMFDTLYALELEDFTGPLKQLSRRQRWLLLTAVASLALVWIGAQIASGIGAMVAERNAPTLAERQAAPYDLTENTLYLNPAALPQLPGFTASEVDAAETDPMVACMVTGSNCAANVVDRYVPAVAFSAYAYTETAALEAAAANAVEGEAPAAVGPAFRVQALQFDTPTRAQNALYALFDTDRETGPIGNYVLSPSFDVRYYYSYRTGSVEFVWASGSYIYTVSAPTWNTVNGVMDMLRASGSWTPPAPVGDNVNS
jgi:hypothetical protein